MENIRASKKRKISSEELDEEKQEEETKMETFFALVRSMRETRDRWKNKMNENIIKENRVVDVWKPTFELEDFAEECVECRNMKTRLNSLGGVSDINNKKDDDDAEKGIDLKLSL